MDAHIHTHGRTHTYTWMHTYIHMDAHIHTHGRTHTCTRFQKGDNSASGSVATEQDAPINIILIGSKKI